MLIDVIFLRLASVLSSEADEVTVVPGWNGLNTGRPSLENVVDYLVARRPAKYSGGRAFAPAPRPRGIASVTTDRFPGRPDPFRAGRGPQQARLGACWVK